MQIYHYNQDGIYLGDSAADPSPLEPGVFLIPANATGTKPPSFKDGYLRRFVNGIWEEQYIEPIPEVVTPIEPEPPTNTVPQEISKAQGIVIMSQVVIDDSNLWRKVKAYFDTEADEISRDLFYAIQVFNRQSPMLNSLKAQFGLDDAGLDNLFIEGAKVVV